MFKRKEPSNPYHRNFNEGDEYNRSRVDGEGVGRLRSDLEGSGKMRAEFEGGRRGTNTLRGKLTRRQTSMSSSDDGVQTTPENTSGEEVESEGGMERGILLVVS